MSVNMIVKIVTVKHPGCGTPYTFRVPDNLDLKAGDRVLCNTKKAHCEMARCMTPSFEIIEPVLEELYGLKIEKLQPVVGFLKPIMYAYKKAEEDE